MPYCHSPAFVPIQGGVSEPPAVDAGGLVRVRGWHNHLGLWRTQVNSHLRLASYLQLSRGYPQLYCTQEDGHLPLWSHLRLASHLRPLQTVLRLTQSGAAAQSAMGVDGGLGATEPGVFERLLHGSVDVYLGVS